MSGESLELSSSHSVSFKAKLGGINLPMKRFFRAPESGKLRRVDDQKSSPFVKLAERANSIHFLLLLLLLFAL